jgi:hypothetical protein
VRPLSTLTAAQILPLDQERACPESGSESVGDLVARLRIVATFLIRTDGLADLLLKVSCLGLGVDCHQEALCLHRVENLGRLAADAAGVIIDALHIALRAGPLGQARRVA